MGRKGVETLVGLFVLLGILAILFLALRAANLGNFVIGDTYVVTARFDNIGGLKVRAPVKSAGVTVGRVKAIALDTNTYQGRVTMELEQGMMFPSDTSAKILTSGLLGDQFIGLVPGGSDKNLEPGGEIKLTQSAVLLENLIGQFLYNKAADPPDALPATSKKVSLGAALALWPLTKSTNKARVDLPAPQRRSLRYQSWQQLSCRVALRCLQIPAAIRATRSSRSTVKYSSSTTSLIARC